MSTSDIASLISSDDDNKTTRTDLPQQLPPLALSDATDSSVALPEEPPPPLPDTNPTTMVNSNQKPKPKQADSNSNSNKLHPRRKMSSRAPVSGKAAASNNTPKVETTTYNQLRQRTKRTSTFDAPTASSRSRNSATRNNGSSPAPITSPRATAPTSPLPRCATVATAASSQRRIQTAISSPVQSQAFQNAVASPRTNVSSPPMKTPELTSPVQSPPTHEPASFSPRRLASPPRVVRRQNSAKSMNTNNSTPASPLPRCATRSTAASSQQRIQQNNTAQKASPATAARKKAFVPRCATMSPAHKQATKYNHNQNNSNNKPKAKPAAPSPAPSTKTNATPNTTPNTKTMAGSSAKKKATPGSANRVPRCATMAPAHKQAQKWQSPQSKQTPQKGTPATRNTTPNRKPSSSSTSARSSSPLVPKCASMSPARQQSQKWQPPSSANAYSFHSRSPPPPPPPPPPPQQQKVNRRRTSSSSSNVHSKNKKMTTPNRVNKTMTAAASSSRQTTSQTHDQRNQLDDTKMDEKHPTAGQDDEVNDQNHDNSSPVKEVIILDDVSLPNENKSKQDLAPGPVEEQEIDTTLKTNYSLETNSIVTKGTRDTEEETTGRTTPGELKPTDNSLVHIDSTFSDDTMAMMDNIGCDHWASFGRGDNENRKPDAPSPGRSTRPTLQLKVTPSGPRLPPSGSNSKKNTGNNNAFGTPPRRMSIGTPPRTPNNNNGVLSVVNSPSGGGRPSPSMILMPSPLNSARSTCSRFSWSGDGGSVYSNMAEGEERIQVSIRMRPLDSNDQGCSRAWKLAESFNSITQILPNGEPVHEPAKNRSVFMFDKVMPEETTNDEVYNSVAKSIVADVVSGLNGTVFAYGQTASGKTYTMQGSGSIAEGFVQGEGGIVQMAAADIFRQIAQQSKERMFLVRVSALEIYNEAVVDLLQPETHTNLNIREDPERGIFVQSHEEIVTDVNSLLFVLFQGDKERSVASTNMNVRSSRSHTIFRITIESRAIEKEHDDENGDDASSLGGSDETPPVLVSTLNLVDLAGSESVRNTGATGERQKEGSRINQSLLALSRVIKALSSKSAPHINFRDSKLTRILQPHLSGNAKIAFVCCATPSDRYLEETRSTLAFAARAKLVKTHATVNKIIGGSSLIGDLQTQLTLANSRRAFFETQAESANSRVERLIECMRAGKRSILLFNSNPRRKPARRFSDSESCKRSKNSSRTDHDPKRVRSLTPTRLVREPKLFQPNKEAESGLLRLALTRKGLNLRGLEEMHMQATHEKAEMQRAATFTIQKMDEKISDLHETLDASHDENNQTNCADPGPIMIAESPADDRSEVARLRAQLEATMSKNAMLVEEQVSLLRDLQEVNSQLSDAESKITDLEGENMDLRNLLFAAQAQQPESLPDGAHTMNQTQILAAKSLQTEGDNSISVMQANSLVGDEAAPKEEKTLQNDLPSIVAVESKMISLSQKTQPRTIPPEHTKELLVSAHSMSKTWQEQRSGLGPLPVLTETMMQDAVDIIDCLSHVVEKTQEENELLAERCESLSTDFSSVSVALQAMDTLCDERYAVVQQLEQDQDKDARAALEERLEYLDHQLQSTLGNIEGLALKSSLSQMSKLGANSPSTASKSGEGVDQKSKTQASAGQKSVDTEVVPTNTISTDSEIDFYVSEKPTGPSDDVPSDEEGDTGSVVKDSLVHARATPSEGNRESDSHGQSILHLQETSTEDESDDNSHEPSTTPSATTSSSEHTMDKLQLGASSSGEGLDKRSHEHSVIHMRATLSSEDSCDEHQQILSLQEQLEDAKAAIDSIQVEKAISQKVVEEFRQTLQEYEVEQLHLREELKIANDESKQSQAEADKLELQLQHATSELQERQQELARRNQELEEMIQRNAKQEQDDIVTDLKDKLLASSLQLQESVTESQQIGERYAREIQDLREKIEEKTQAASNAIDRCTQLQQDIDDLTMKHQQVVKERSSLEAEVSTLRTKLADLKPCETSLSNDIASDINAKLMSELEKQQEEAVVQHEVEQLQKELSAAIEKERLVSSESIQLHAELERKLEESQNLALQSQLELEERQSELEESQQVADELQQKVEAMKKEMEDLQRVADQSLVEKQGKLDICLKDIEQLHHELEERQLEMDKQQQEAVQLHEELEEKQNEIDQQQQDAEWLRFEIEGKQNEVEHSQQLANQLRSELDGKHLEMEESRKVAEETIAGIEKKLTNTRLKVEELIGELKTSTKNLESIVVERDGLAQQILELRTDLETRADDNQRLRNELEKVSSEKETLQNELTGKVENAKSENATLKHELSDKGWLPSQMLGEGGSLPDAVAKLEVPATSYQAMLDENARLTQELEAIKKEISDSTSRDFTAHTPVTLKDKFKAVTEEREKLSMKIAALVTTDEDARAEVEVLKELLDQANCSVAASNAEERRLEAQLKEASNELSKMKDVEAALNSATGTIAELKDSNEKTLAELEGTRKECASLRSEMEGFNESCRIAVANEQMTAEKLKTSETALISVSEELSEVRNKHAVTSEVAEKLHNTESALTSLSEEFTMLQKEHNAKSEELEQFHSAYNLLRSLILATKETLAKESMMDQSGLEELASAAKKLTVDLETLKHENQALQERCAAEEAKVGKLQESLSSLESVDLVWREKNQKLQETYNMASEELDNAIEENMSLQAENKELECQMKSQKDELEVSLEQQQALSAKISELEDEGQKARAEIKSLQVNVALSNGSVEASNFENEKKEALLQETSERLQETAAKLNQLEQDLESANETNDRLKSERVAVDEELQETHSELLTALEELNNLQEEQKTVENKLQSSTSENTRLSQELETAQSGLSEANATNKKLLEKSDRATTEHDELQKSYFSLRARFDESENSRIGLSQQCTVLQTKLKESDDLVKKTRSERDAVSHAMDKLNHAAKEFHNDVGQLMSEKQELARECHKLENKVNSLKKNIGAASAETKSAKKDLARLREERDALARANDHLSTEYESMNKENEDQENEIKRLHDEVARLSREAEDMKTEIGHSKGERDELERLRTELQRALAEAEALRKDVQFMKADRDNLLRELEYTKSQHLNPGSSILEGHGLFSKLTSAQVDGVSARPIGDDVPDIETISTGKDSLTEELGPLKHNGSSGTSFSSSQEDYSQDESSGMGSSHGTAAEGSVHFLGARNANSSDSSTLFHQKIERKVQKLRTRDLHGSHHWGSSHHRSDNAHSSLDSADDLDQLVRKVETASAAAKYSGGNLSRNNKSTMSWDEGYHALELYLKGYPFTEIPEWFVDKEGRDLGNWIGDRRHEWMEGRLPTNQVTALNRLCSFWKLEDSSQSRRDQSQLNLSWETWLEALDSFARAYGGPNSDVPKWYKDPMGRNLGYWVNKQRVKMSNGTLAPKRIHDLEARGFVF